MSMFRRPMDIKDRIQGKLQGSSAFRTGIRTVKQASRRAGGNSSSSSKTKSGSINLQYKSLQEPTDRDFEAVLDAIGTTSDAHFASSLSHTTSKHTSKEHVPSQQTTTKAMDTSEKRSNPSIKSIVAMEDDDPSSVAGIDRDIVIDPLLGQVIVPHETEISRTDSEEDEGESEDIELDSETVDVLKSLNLMDKGLFDSEPLAVSIEHDIEGGGRDSNSSKKGEKEGELSGGRKTTLTVNELANNNTHNHNAISSSESPHNTTHNLTTGQEPTLEDLLERGSAALQYRSTSPRHASPLNSPPTLADSSSSSPLTSSYEVEPSYNMSNSPATTRQTTQPRVQSTIITGQKHIGFNETGNVTRQNEVTVAREDEDDLFSDATLSQSDSSSHRTYTDNRESDLFHNGTLNDRATVSKKRDTATITSHSAGNDELFPDDARLLEHSTTSKQSSDLSNTLDIREDHFSSSPEEQRKQKIKSQASGSSPRMSPSLKQNSTGRVAPARPPHSPQLVSRLKLRQKGKTNDKSTKKSTHKTYTVPHSHKQQQPVANNDDTDIVKALGSTLAPAEINQTESIKRQHNTNTNIPQETTNSIEIPSTSPVNIVDSTNLAATHTTESVSSQQNTISDTDIDSVELPFLPPNVHLFLCLLLYFYYTFNPFVYLAGLMTGFLVFYLCLGAVFVAYVQKEEEAAAVDLTGSAESLSRGLSAEFMKSMNIRLEDYETRFNAPSHKHKFRFTATLHYDVATHHRRDRYPCRLKLIGDYEMHVCVFDSEGNTLLKKQINLYEDKAQLTIVPQDVFENRKRRWNKKYPIHVEVGDTEFFLFSNVSRFKQEWFFRLREAAQGTKTKTLVQRQVRFFEYMQHYFPSELLRNNTLSSHSSVSMPSEPTSGTRGIIGATSTTAGPPARTTTRYSTQKKHKLDEGSVEFHSVFSNSSTVDDVIGGGAVSISKSHTPSYRREQRDYSITSSTSSAVSEYHSGRSPSIRSTAGGGATVNPITPMPPSFESNWINALTARLYWDVWHEQRWKNWITSRIQRKLVRIKTPGFLDPLQLTDIEIGDSMPVINSLHEGPYLRVDGVWIYLDVTYDGLFVMTIKTRLKLGGGKGEEEKGKNVKHNSRVSHTQAAAMFQESSGYPTEDDSDTGSEEEEEEDRQSLTNPLEEDDRDGEMRGKESPQSTASVQPHNKRKARAAKLKKVMTRITRKVASNRLVRRAAEKASSVPLELTVEIKKLKGVVAINIPPPPCDTIWYGFMTTPKLELVAKPRLGKRAVTLSQITHWIERKLCSLVDEKLTLPNMEDVVIPVLNSGLPEDIQKTL